MSKRKLQINLIFQLKKSHVLLNLKVPSIVCSFSKIIDIFCHAFLSFFFFFINLFIFIYLWLCWVFVSVRGLSPVVASEGHSSSWCAGLSLSRPPLLRSTGSRCAGSVIAAHGPSCSAACGILPDQGTNPCPLHWQADSQPLRHQGSPCHAFLAKFQITQRHQSSNITEKSRRHCTLIIYPVRFLKSL